MCIGCIGCAGFHLLGGDRVPIGCIFLGGGVPDFLGGLPPPNGSAGNPEGAREYFTFSQTEL